MDSEGLTTVHQVDLNAGHVGKRVVGTTGGVDFEGVLTAVHHDADEEIYSLTSGRVRTRTTVTVGGHDFLLARGSQVQVR